MDLAVRVGLHADDARAAVTDLREVVAVEHGRQRRVQLPLPKSEHSRRTTVPFVHEFVRAEAMEVVRFWALNPSTGQALKHFER